MMFFTQVQSKISEMTVNQDSFNQKLNNINTSMFRDKETLFRVESQTKKLKLYMEENEIQTNTIKTDIANLTKDEEEKDWKYIDKFRQIDTQMRELAGHIQHESTLDSKELARIKTLVEEKIETDKIITNTEKEKSRALFNEVVRLGEHQEKLSQTMGSFTIQAETRLQSIEKKGLIVDQMSSELRQIGMYVKDELKTFTEKMNVKLAYLDKEISQLNVRLKVRFKINKRA